MYSLHGTEQKCTVRMWIWNPNAKRSLLRYISTRKDNIKIDIKKICTTGVEGIFLALCKNRLSRCSEHSNEIWNPLKAKFTCSVISATFLLSHHHFTNATYSFLIYILPIIRVIDSSIKQSTSLVHLKWQNLKLSKETIIYCTQICPQSKRSLFTYYLHLVCYTVYFVICF